jgi:hypothetical protein
VLNAWLSMSQSLGSDLALCLYSNPSFYRPLGDSNQIVPKAGTLAAHLVAQEPVRNKMGD